MKQLLRPILTEKAAEQMSNGLYAVEIGLAATKNSITSELKTHLGVDAVSVRIVNLPAKNVKFRRIPGRQPVRRKAYIQLAKNQKLPGFELPKQKEEKSTPAKESK